MRFRFVTLWRYRRRPLLIGLLMASVSVLPVHAFENVRREAKHFFECLGLMISDPAMHEENCLPNRVPGPFGSIQSPGDGSGVVVVAPVVVPPAAVPPVVAPPVAAPPAPPVVPPACACGACYVA